MTQTPFYVTTAIYYANAAPHIGHTYEVIGADVIARLHRLLGDTVFFLTGTDEHGIKVEKTAAKHEQSPKAYVDNISGHFHTAWKELGVTFDRFIRTSEPKHYEAVSKLWRQLVQTGDIYKATYQGLYCSGCETFLLPRDLDPEGKCQIHQTAPDAVAEENYFFRLSQYKDRLLKLYEDHPEMIQPAFRKQEVLNQLAELEDISVSRSTKSVTWGIPVPDDPDQVIYVWIDALSNYLTGVGWETEAKDYQEFWPPDVQVIGKDILRFHAIYWPAMLMAANILLPKTLLVHGFITVGDTKISKSLGNVISHQDLMERFGLDTVDPIRYYMMASTPFGQDGSYTDEEFKNRINADLANNLGNLLNRTLNMLQKYAEGKIPQASPEAETLLDKETLNQIEAAYRAYDFTQALHLIMGVVDTANKLINDKEPWTLFKEEKYQAVSDVMYAVLEALRQVAILLSPVTPTLSTRILNQLGYPTEGKIPTWSCVTQKPLPAGQIVNSAEPILPRLDSDIVGAAKKK